MLTTLLALYLYYVNNRLLCKQIIDDMVLVTKHGLSSHLYADDTRVIGLRNMSTCHHGQTSEPAVRLCWRRGSVDGSQSSRTQRRQD